MAKHGPSSPPAPPPISPLSSSFRSNSSRRFRSSSTRSNLSSSSPKSVAVTLAAATEKEQQQLPPTPPFPMEHHPRHHQQQQHARYVIESSNQIRHNHHSRNTHHRRKRSIPGSGDTGSATSATTFKSVTFHHRIKARAHLSRFDMTVQEHRACWFQEDEYKAIERRNERAIVRIERTYETNYGHIHCNANQSPVCPRGLECGLRSEYMTSEAYKMAAKEEVFLEQQKQHRRGFYDDKAIARAYKTITRKCRFRAHTKAVLDRKEVEDDCYSTVELTDDEADEDCDESSPFGTTRPNRRSLNDTKEKRSRPFAAVRLWVAKHSRKTTPAES